MILDILSRIEEQQKRIEFDDLMHTYWYDGKNVGSVTQLLQKHKLAPIYENVDTKTLKRACERGNKIHKDIELYVNKENAPKTAETKKYIQMLSDKGIVPIKAEFKVGNEIVCGTCDTLLSGNGKFYIDDHKTGTTVHTDAVRWQGSLYAYLLGIYDKIDKIVLSHLPKDIEKSKLLFLDKIPLDEIERLLECERNGYIYKEEPKELCIKELAEVEKIQNEIIAYDKIKKGLQEREKQLRETILKAMQENAIYKLETDGVSITRKKSYKISKFDAKSFGEEHKKLYNKYIKESEVAESLLIKIKGE